jgi:hypothetical protein
MENAFEGMRQEIEFLTAEVNANRVELSMIENRTKEAFAGWVGFDRTHPSRIQEAKLLREKIAVEQARIDDLTATRNALLDREREREANIARRKEWEALVPVCRKLKDEHRAQELLVLKLRDARETAQLKRDHAINAVNEHAANPPSWDDFPTKLELEEYRVDGVELEEARAAAAAAFGEADRAHAREVTALVNLQWRFQRAVNSEASLRPKDLSR